MAYKIAPVKTIEDLVRVLNKTFATVVNTDAPSAGWPIGSIFISTVSTNPATLLGFGTWELQSSGRMTLT